MFENCRNSKWLHRFVLPVTVALSILVIYFLVCVFSGIVPFSRSGNNTLAWNDAYFQYLDFFAWYKDLLSGKQSLSYTFSSSLGQNPIGIFSYYLASPFNLLIVFFSKDNLNAFFNIIIGLKWAAAGITMSVYLSHRFKEKLEPLWIYILSVCYGLMQYMFSQSSNIMWLDGVYMLPLILLGVYYAVNKKNGILLSISVGLSILFNWYSAGINCLLAIIFFFAEYFMSDEHSHLFRKFVLFCVSMLVGIMLSAVLFLPTIHVMTQGKGSSFDLSQIKNILFQNPLTIIKEYQIGELSSYGFPALYFGSIPLIGVIGFFVSKQIPFKKKLAGLIFLVFLILCFYWQPLFMVFSLLKEARSYAYRYAYIMNAGMIFLAAYYFENLKDLKKNRVIVTAAVYLAVFLIMNIKFWPVSRKLCVITVLSSLLIVFVLYRYVQGKRRQVCALLLAVVTFGELGLNGFAVARKFKAKNADQFDAYNKEEAQLISDIQENDAGVYRITQTMSRAMDYEKTTANLNESMAFDYMSVENYTSSPQNDQIEMFAKFGYPTYEDCAFVKTAFLLPVDSLMGVKYILSPYELEGMEKVTDEKVNGKYVYQNPYALPFAFAVNSVSDVAYDDNPFEYWNAVYQKLTGSDIQIMKKLDYTVDNSNGKLTYNISVPSGDYVLYGNLAYDHETEGKLNLNGNMTMPYSGWLTQHAFYIPNYQNSSSVTVTYSAKDLDHPFTDVQFYALDMTQFQKAVRILSKHEPADITVENGHVSIDMEVDEDSVIYTSVPYDKGWTVTVNEKQIEPEKFDDCLMCIPVEKGYVHIEMDYTLPGCKAGIAVSVMGIVLICLECIIMKKNGERER